MNKQVTIKEIEQAAAKVWEVPEDTLYLKRRYREMVEPRQAIFHYRRTQLNHKPSRIERETGFDHATVNHAVKTVDNLRSTDAHFKRQYEQFLNALG